MLADPNDESPANIDAAKMWREDRKGTLEYIYITLNSQN